LGSWGLEHLAPDGVCGAPLVVVLHSDEEVRARTDERRVPALHLGGLRM